MNIILLYFSLKYKGDWDKIYEALERKEKVAITEIQKLEQRVKDEKIQYFTILDNKYPEGFKNTYKPPFVIYYKGNIDLISRQGYVLTGNDEKNKHINQNIDLVIEDMCKNHVLFTSLHKGVDELVYERAKNKTSIIFISADNINNPYASVSIRGIDLTKNLIISEYFENEHVTKNSLRARNRLLASLPLAIVLVSSDEKSGINNLISNALNIGKDVYCLPDDPKNLSGNSELIKQGAALITCYNDLSHKLQLQNEK